MRWLLVVLAVSACGGSSPAPAGSCDASAYPCGPYGYGVGSVIANLTVQGQRDANGDGTATDDPVAPISLADYRRFAALAIVVGAESCVPCQNEQATLVSLWKSDQPRVAFLEAIVQGAGGAPADQTVIDSWATRFQLPFDISADPTGALAPYYNASNFPSAMAIRTSDMQIVYQVTGPADGLKGALDQILAP